MTEYIQTMFGRFESLVAAAAVLLMAAAAREFLRRRAGRRWSGRDWWGLAAGALMGFCGVVASVLLASRGAPRWPLDPALLVVAVGLGWWRPLRTGAFWAGWAVGLVASAVLGPMALPGSAKLAGVDEARFGAEVEVRWSLDGARVLIVDPLDPPREFVNGRRTDLSTLFWTGLDDAFAAGCPDGANEEQAALDAFMAGNLDQAVARGRLALLICEAPPLARAVVGEALLRRAVTALRTGKARRAAEDLAEADGLLDEPGVRARLERAQSRLESIRPAPRPEGLLEPHPPPEAE